MTITAPDLKGSGIRLLARLVSDDAAFAAWQGSEADQRALWEAAAAEGADRLLAARVRPDLRWSAGDRRAAREILTRATAIEALQRRELLRLVQAFAAASIPMLVVKGAAWAFTLYPSPELRPRQDTDVLIDPASRQAADDALVDLGYRPAVESAMELASAQRHYTRLDDVAVPHHVDLHWRAANPLVFARALPFSRVYERSVAVAALEGGRTLCATDALLLACLHRVAHHGHESGLVWLLDVHLIASRLTAAEWETLVRSAEENALAGVCARTLARAIDWFGTPVPDGVLVWIARAGAESADAVFLGRGVSPLGVFMSDWRAIGTWMGRLRLVKDHVFPPSSYMFARYGTRHQAVLPFLYGQRALGGLCRWVFYGR
jgi:hypothetical protein